MTSLLICASKTKKSSNISSKRSQFVCEPKKNIIWLNLLLKILGFPKHIYATGTVNLKFLEFQ